MSETKKFLDAVGVTTSFDRIETSKIPKEYKHWMGSAFCYRFEVGSKKNKVTEQFFIPRDMTETSDQLGYVVRTCTWMWGFGNIHQINYLKLCRIFQNDFSEALHSLLLDQMNGGKSADLLALALAEFPETSEKTLRLILTQNFSEGTVNKVLQHPAAKNLAPFA
jgi:hypothetical protein